MSRRMIAGLAALAAAGLAACSDSTGSGGGFFRMSGFEIVQGASVITATDGDLSPPLNPDEAFTIRWASQGSPSEFNVVVAHSNCVPAGRQVEPNNLDATVGSCPRLTFSAPGSSNFDIASTIEELESFLAAVDISPLPGGLDWSAFAVLIRYGNDSEFIARLFEWDFRNTTPQPGDPPAIVITQGTP